MAATDLGAVANRLFEGFLAPIVLGGEVSPGRPIGARAALALGSERVVADSSLLSRVQIARTRIARRWVPVDRVSDPTEAEWALGAALHDLVQATHPGFDSAFRRRAPSRIVDLVEATVERVPPPASVGESLSRHTWFSRLFEMHRNDTVIRWWVGSRTFLGETPPARLSSWPELRRVHVETSAREVMDLPSAGSAVDATRFGNAMSRWLARTPLTDIAMCHRPTPAFTWGEASLGLVATGPGRLLAGRALASGPKPAIDAALGRATRALVAGRAWKAAGVAIDLLADRALEDAVLAARGSSDGPNWARPGGAAPAEAAARQGSDDALYARSVGALVALDRLAAPVVEFGEDERAELRARLTPAATSAVGRAAKAQLEEATSSC